MDLSDLLTQGDVRGTLELCTFDSFFVIFYFSLCVWVCVVVAFCLVNTVSPVPPPPRLSLFFLSFSVLKAEGGKKGRGRGKARRR
jgi:hypothetical protein